MLVISIFSFFHNVFYPSTLFYPSQNKFLFFSHIYFVICKCFQFGPMSLKFCRLVKSWGEGTGNKPMCKFFNGSQICIFHSFICNNLKKSSKANAFSLKKNIKLYLVTASCLVPSEAGYPYGLVASYSS